MPRKKKEEAVPAVENAAEAAAEAVVSETPVEKPKRGRRKKADAVVETPEKKTTRKPRTKKTVEEKAEAVAEEVKKAVTRRPRKKAVVPNFVIQNSADDGITYDAVVKKVEAAIQIADVTSIDIYVKAEEGKAYYVVNGEAAGAVDLF